MKIGKYEVFISRYYFGGIRIHPRIQTVTNGNSVELFIGPIYIIISRIITPTTYRSKQQNENPIVNSVGSTGSLP